MSTFLAWSGGLGGACVFVAGVTAVVRSIFRLADATGDNTQAIKDLTATVGNLNERVSDNSLRIARMEGQRRR